MRLFVLAVALYATAFSYAQPSRIVSGTDAQGKAITGYVVGNGPAQWQRQEIVTAPATAPAIWVRHPYQNSNHMWNGDPFTKPFPGGTYEIRNASIDKAQKTGAWSSPATVTVQSGAHLYCGGWNLPVLQYESGVVWKAKCISLDPECTGWGMNVGDEFHLGYALGHTSVAQNISPSVACEPDLMKLVRQAPYNYPLSRLNYGGFHQGIAQPPVVVPTSLPNKRVRIAYCFVAENGETALSPPTPWSNPVQVAGWTDAKAMELLVFIKDYWPQGALGYRVYLQVENDQAPWRRLPAPHCHGAPVRDDDYLFQLWDRQAQLYQYYPDAPTHRPAAEPKSELSGLHLALKYTGWFPWAPIPADIVIECGNVNITCPLHDEWGTNGTGHPFKFKRRVTAPNGGAWTVTQTPGTHRYWPLLHVSNQYSRWTGCTFAGDGASAGLSFDDFAGGQVFGNRFVECGFYPGATKCGGLSYGMIVCERSTASFGNHTHSEGRYQDCTFGGDVSMRIGGNQTANLQFIDTLSSCNGPVSTSSVGRRGVVLWMVCPNEVRFRGLWGADSFGPPIVFVSGYNAKLNCDHMWKDQLSSAIFEVQTGHGIDAEIRSGKFNFWSDPGYQPTLARFANVDTLASISLKAMQSQYSYWPTTADICSPNVNRVETRFEKTVLDGQVALVEPSYPEWVIEFIAIFGPWSPPPPKPAMPGMKITMSAQTIPAQTVPVSSAGSGAGGKQAVTSTVTIPAQTLPAQDVVFNSMTGQVNVTRRAWK